MSSRRQKVLFLRLSSLGDVILASSALAAPGYQAWDKHFLSSQDYATLIKGHPLIKQVHLFDRRSGLKNWLKLCEALRLEGFDEVVDLHSSMRTLILRLYFLLKGFSSASVSRPRFRVLRKRRLATYGFFLFRKLWPKSFRPRALLDEVSDLVRSNKRLLPSMHYLLSDSGVHGVEVSKKVPSADHKARSKKRLLGVMPSSNWRTKEWPLEKWVELLDALQEKTIPVIFGTPRDHLAVALLEALAKMGIEIQSHVGEFSLAEVAQKINEVDLFMGCDTGLCHLAQALKKPTLVLFGPTHEESGYPVWGVNSSGIGKRLWCRPCGKTGKRCIQALAPHKCLKELSTLEVLAFVNEKLKG